MRTILACFLLLVLSAVSIRPLFWEGWFPMHDDTQVGRVVAMGRALRNGQFPVRWVTDLGYGYGYPLFNFYGPLPYYLGGTLYALGFSGLVATKIMFAIGIIGAAISMFLFVRYLWGNLAGVVAAMTYLYAPYHAVQIYVRGAVGEFWVLVFLPLILLGISKRNVVLGGIGLAGVILSHTILGYVTTIGVLLGIIATRERHRVLAICLLGLGFSSFFWLPAMVEMRYTSVSGQIGQTAFWADHFACLVQFWHSEWGFGGSIPGCIDGLSFKLGKVNILMAAAGILVTVLGWKSRLHMHKGILIISGLILGFSIYLMIPESGWIWKILPNASFIQYPWRMLAFTIFSIAVFSGVFIGVAPNRMLRALIGVFVTGIIIAVNGKLFVPQFSYARADAAFETDQELRWRVSKVSDEYLPPEVTRPNDELSVAKTTIKEPGNGSVETEIDTEVYTKAQITLGESQIVTINRAHFPGWRYFIEGKEITPVIARGLPTIEFPQGSYLLESRFTDTSVRIIGNVTSLVTAIVVLTYLSYHEKKAHA